MSQYESDFAGRGRSRRSDLHGGGAADFGTHGYSAEPATEWGEAAVPEPERILWGRGLPIVHPTGLDGPTASELGFGQHDPRSTGTAGGSSQRARKQPAVSDSDAQSVVLAAADIVQHKRKAMIASTSPRFHAALESLFIAVTGHRNKEQLSGADQVEMLDAAMVSLEPAIVQYRTTPDGAQWLAAELMTHVAEARKAARFTRAKDRVDNAVKIGHNVVELPGDDKPRAQGLILRAQIEKFTPTVAVINEQVIRMHHDAIHHQAAALSKGEAHGHAFGPGALVQLQGALWAVDGFLTLTDKELQHELNHIHGVFNGVSTYAELVKVATELLASGVIVTASYGAVVAKFAGDSATAAACTGLARAVGLKFGNVIAGVEAIHGFFVAVDSHAAPQARLEGAVHTATGVAYFAGKSKFGLGVGVASSTAILLGYAQFKLAVQAYGNASLSITSGLMRPAFETLQRDGEAIATAADQAQKADALLKSEADPANAADLERVRQLHIKQLAESIDTLLDDCGPQSLEAGVAKYPGAHRVLAELFAPLQKYRRASLDTAMEGASEALKTVSWALSHAADMIGGSARHQPLHAIQRDVANQQENAHEK